MSSGDDLVPNFFGDSVSYPLVSDTSSFTPLVPSSFPTSSLLTSPTFFPSPLTSVTSYPPPFSSHDTPTFTLPQTSSPSIPSSSAIISPSLTSSPATTPPEMAVQPIIYVIAGCLVLGILLVSIVSLICCIAICLRFHRKKPTRQSFKGESSIDGTKSLQAYNGGSPHSLRKKDDSATRYELQTVDVGNRMSTGSNYTHNSLSGKTPSPGTRLHSAADSPQISSLPRDPHSSNDYCTGVGTFTGHVIPSTHCTTAGLQQSDFQLPDRQSAQAKIAAEIKAGLLATEGNPAKQTLDPISLYDVPSSALANAAVTLPLSGGPRGLYDVPKSALIASGHYKVPPLALGVPGGIEDEHPSALYDVPPCHEGSDLYDVPPPSWTRPRLNSLPTSKELVDARTSVFGSPGSDNAFATGDAPHLGLDYYSHYDVPKSLMMAYLEENNTAPTQSGNRLSRRNSNPTTLYDVPRKAMLMADYTANLPGPPTAPKPSKSGRKVSRSSSMTSPLGSPDYRPHPNAIFYHIHPLDPEVLAQRGVQSSTSSERKTSQHEETSTHQQNRAPVRRHSLPSKKKRVPPPTRTKPKKKDESEHKQ